MSRAYPADIYLFKANNKRKALENDVKYVHR